MSSAANRTIIIGAGLAGLSAATALQAKNRPFLLIEAEKEVGGRIKTDVIDGFTLDHGFQVLLDSYENAKKLFDYQALKLNSFEPGALIRKGNKFHYVGDPLRRPSSALSTLGAPIGSFQDKSKLAFLALAARSQGWERKLKRYRETPAIAIDTLERMGFSSDIIQSFFKPFFSGVFLDESLQIDTEFFLYLFGRFAQGAACLPSKGMQALPEQLKNRLPQDSLMLGTRVKSIKANEITLADGSLLSATSVILAIDRSAAKKLLGLNNEKDKSRHTTCVYFECSGLD